MSESALATTGENKSAFEIAEKMGAEDLLELGETLIKSGFLPDKVTTPEKATAIMLQSEELGLPMMAGFRGIDVIHGNPTVKPELMHALAKRTGELEYLNYECNTDDPKEEWEAVTTVKREGDDELEYKFTWEMAQNMKTKQDGQTIPLTKKYNWKTMPETMIEWRSKGGALRRSFPDVLHGLYLPDEAKQVDAQEADYEVVEEEESEDQVQEMKSTMQDQVTEDDPDESQEEDEEDYSEYFKNYRDDFRAAQKLAGHPDIDVKANQTHDVLIEEIDSAILEGEFSVPAGVGEKIIEDNADDDTEDESPQDAEDEQESAEEASNNSIIPPEKQEDERQENYSTKEVLSEFERFVNKIDELEELHIINTVSRHGRHPTIISKMKNHLIEVQEGNKDLGINENRCLPIVS